MDEESIDRLCGLFARLRQQHTALGVTFDEIEACLAGKSPAPSGVERSHRAAERVSELPRRPSPDPEPAAG